MLICQLLRHFLEVVDVVEEVAQIALVIGVECLADVVAAKDLHQEDAPFVKHF
jgi:hypothetical protein